MTKVANVRAANAAKAPKRFRILMYHRYFCLPYLSMQAHFVMIHLDEEPHTYPGCLPFGTDPSAHMAAHTDHTVVKMRMAMPRPTTTTRWGV